MASKGAEQWRTLVTQFAGDIPVEFLLSWIEHESDGNPCSIGGCTTASGTAVSCGNANATFNREAGIFQTDHPSDDKFGATSPQLRAMCAGTLQKITRQPTLEEQVLHVQSGINYVNSERQVVQNALSAVSANWPETSADFWTLVKSRHGARVIATDLLPAVARQLGHPPVSWAEFVNTYLKMPANAIPASLQGLFASKSNAGRRNRLDDVMANAEATGKAAGDFIKAKGVESSGLEDKSGNLALGLLAVGAIIGLGYMSIRFSRHLAAKAGLGTRQRKRKRSSKQLGINNIEIERIAKDADEAGRKDEAALIRAAEIKPYKKLSVMVKPQGERAKRATIEDFEKACGVHTSGRAAFCELKNTHELLDKSVLVTVREEPYGRKPVTTWLLHYDDYKKALTHLLIKHAVVDYRHYKQSREKKGKREPALLDTQNLASSNKRQKGGSGFTPPPPARAIVTAEEPDGARRGFPGQRMIRYQIISNDQYNGSWAWMPAIGTDTNVQVGDEIIV